MEKWFVPEYMKQSAGSTITKFGIDQQGLINYTFDSIGFRNNNELSHDPNLIIVGNSISFGLGINQTETFGHLTSKKINIPMYNISFGATLHENHDHLPNIRHIANRNVNDIIILQINNLGRQRIDDQTVTICTDKHWCKKRFINYFDELTGILKGTHAVFLYWDDVDYDLPKAITDQFLIYNKLHIDNSLPKQSTFGIKTNTAIAKVLTYQLRKIG